MNSGSKRGRPALPANERLGERRVVRMRSDDALRLERLAIALGTNEANVLRIALDALVRSQREASV